MTHHFRSTQKNENIFFTVDMADARGAAASLIECQYGVDILDEWALLPCLADFPVVVAPEQDYMSEEMVHALMNYVNDGGKLLVSGANALKRFGGEFLGVSEGRLIDNNIYHVPTQDESVPVQSEP